MLWPIFIVYPSFVGVYAIHVISDSIEKLHSRFKNSADETSRIVNDDAVFISYLI